MKKLCLLATLAAILGLQVTYNLPSVMAATVDVDDEIATLDTSTGNGVNTTPTTVADGDDINFTGDFDLTITGDGTTIVTSLGTITTDISNAGVLILDLDANAPFAIDEIGAAGSALGTLTVKSGDISVGDSTIELLTVDGGTLTLTGTNLINVTAMNGGTIVADAVNVLASSVETFIGTGATFDMNGYGQTLNSLYGEGTIFNDGGSDAALTLNNAIDEDTIFGGIFDNTGNSEILSIEKTGLGTLTLTGDNSNYDGTVTVTEGRLNLGDGSSTAALDGSVVVAAGAAIGGQEGVIGGGLTIATGGTFVANADATGAYNGLTVVGDLDFANGALVDMTGVTESTGDIFGGYTTDSQDYLQAALDWFGDDVFFGYEAVAQGIDVADYRNDANISDIYLSSLLMHDNGAIRKATSDRITQNFRYWNDPCVRKCKPSGRSVWVDYVGRKSDLRSHYNSRDMDFESNGVQVGVDLYSNRCTQFGVMFGYESQKSDLNVGSGIDQVEADDYYFGFYGARMLGKCTDIRGFLGYGHQSYDYGRWAQNQNSSTFTRRTGSYDGDTFEATVELGRRYYVNPCLSFRPVIAFDMFNNSIEAMQETGGLVAADNYTFGKASLTQLFVRVGSDLQWTRGRLNLNTGAYYSYQFGDNGDTLRSQLSDGTYNGWVRGSDLGNSVITLTAGANYYLNQAQTFSVFGNYFGDIYTDRTGDPVTHWFTVGAQYRF